MKLKTINNMYEEVKPLQAVMFDILREAKRICEKNDIKYFLAYGSLLGAVRHNGYIPWDDDVDICMQYSDFDKFRKACERDLGTDYFLQTPDKEPGGCHTYFKLRKNGTTLIVDSTVDADVHQGINIDIYPIYNMANNIILRKVQLAFTAVFLLLSAGVSPKNHGGIMKWVSAAILKIFSSKFMKERVISICQKQMAKYENRKTIYKSLLFGNMDVCRLLYKSEWFDTSIQHKFEDDMFSIPGGYDGFLKVRYGNYMELPPMEERGVKLQHVIKIDTEKDYKEYKGILYCKKG